MLSINEESLENGVQFCLYLLQDCFRSHHCQPCAPIIEEYSGMVLRFVGGIGLFFSFTEVSG